MKKTMDAVTNNSELCLEGTLEKITFHNPETGYTVMRLAVDQDTTTQDKAEATEVACVGIYVQPKLGAILKLVGNYITHPRYGRQFSFTSYKIAA